MSDARLRELERTWQATGRPQDEAAFLVESVRAGRLTQDELELAGWARHPAALHALGGPLPGPSPDDLSRWVIGLSRWGRPLCVRVAVRALEEVQLQTRVDAISSLTPLRAWCAAQEPRPSSASVDAAPVMSALGPAWAQAPPRESGGLRSLRHLHLGAAIGLTAEAIHADDFAARAANAVVRCEAILGEGECKRPLVAFVTAIALRRPEPPLPSS